jgi:hypothetical protein
MNKLFAAGRPLRENTLDFDLLPIARDDWLHDLPGRFEEMGCRIDPEALEAIVDATPGRPLRTNQVCLQARWALLTTVMVSRTSPSRWCGSRSSL